MNILIPAAGIGRRFKEDDYDKPKPLINVLGDPLLFHIIRNLKLEKDDSIYIVYHQDLNNYNFKYILAKEFHYLNINFIPLNFNTRGPVETVLCGLNKMTNLEEKILILDCDTFYIDDIISVCRGDKENFIFYFDDESDKEIFSYVEIGEDGNIYAIKEKQKISNNACSGAYGFKNGNTLKRYCEATLNSENKSNGEYYISNLYDQMLRDSEIIISHKVSDFHCLGTPLQLKSYCLNEDKNSQKKRFCFDLDNTLVTYPEEYNNYKTVKPIIRNIKLLKYLHKLGHTIIIHTARKMKSSGYNIGKSIKSAQEDVFATLEKYDIPYDEIYFGKPHADFYIDDLCVRPFSNIEKELGFYDAKIESRYFNSIEYQGNLVVKTTNNSGEIYWYKNIPSDLAEHFPKVISMEGNSIKMEKIDGIVFSYLLVNNSLTEHNLKLLLDVIEKIHNSGISDISDVSENYNPKIIRRYREYDYFRVSPDAENYFNMITSKMSEYNNSINGTIHGDLVFSNVFLCDNQVIRFIDMRGKIGETDTIFGDIFYDYAKIYQSLIGYDFILNDYEINVSYLNELRKFFESYFVDKYSIEQLQFLKYITAGLLFSLIPLHTDLEKQKKYFELIKIII